MPKTTNKIWNVEEDEYLRKNYEYEPFDDILTTLKRTKDSVLSRASILGIKKIRKKVVMDHDLNISYFDKIDSPSKAYWYGFLWADGSVYNNSFEFTLQERDKYIIEKFRNDIGSNHKIFKHNKYNTYRFCITSRDFCDSLRKINIVNRKSYSPLLPIFNEKYFLNFFMGLIDGDGSVFTNIDKKIIQVKVVGTPETLRFCQSFLSSYKIDSKIYKIKNCCAERLSIQKKKDVIILLNMLYSNNSFYMNRKKEKYDSFISDDQLSKSVSST